MTSPPPRPARLRLRGISPGVREALGGRLRHRALSFLLALAIGLAGGGLFALAGLPLAWMLGAMTACGAAVILRLPLGTPKAARPPMSALIGAMLGSQFHAGTLGATLEWWPALLALPVFLACGAGLNYLYLRRVARIDPVTAYFCAMPGGLIEMVLIGGARGGDERTIALVHSARIFLVVLCLPTLLSLAMHTEIGPGGRAFQPLAALAPADIAWFAAVMGGGVLLGRLLRLPAPFLIGPMLCSAILHATGLTEFRVPTLLLIGAQVVLGATIGCRFADTAPRRILRILLISSGSTAILMGVSVLFALGLHASLGFDIAAILLAYAPGGLAEMSLVALALEIDVAFVVASHMARIAEVILGAGLLLGMLDRRRARRRPD